MTILTSLQILMLLLTLSSTQNILRSASTIRPDINVNQTMPRSEAPKPHKHTSQLLLLLLLLLAVMTYIQPSIVISDQ